jgi:hypothetical protein
LKKKTKKAPKPADDRPHGIAKSYNDAARAFGVTARSIRDWKVAGGEAAGFRPDGTTDLDMLFTWLEARKADRDGKLSLRDQKIIEEIRKLRIASDEKEKMLVNRAWVAGQIQAAAGEVAALRVKSEAEHPMRFAAAAGDVAACREIVRGVWDEILVSIQGLGRHLSEP